MVTRIPVYDRKGLNKWASIDDVYAPFVARYRWSVWSEDRPPYVNVELPSLPKHSKKYTPLFLSRLIFFLSITNPEHWEYYHANPLKLIEEVKKLQRLKASDGNVYNCTLENLDGTLKPRSQAIRNVAGASAPPSSFPSPSVNVVDDAPHIPLPIRQVTTVNDVLNALGSGNEDKSRTISRKEMGEM